MNFSRYWALGCVAWALTACSPAPEETEPVALVPFTLTDSLRQQAQPGSPALARTHALLTNPLALPDSAPLGLAAFQSRFADCSPRRTPVANRHNPEQVDTLIALRCAGATLQLYQVAGGSTLLQGATLTRPGATLALGLAVGQPLAEARAVAKALYLYVSETNLRLLLEDPDSGATVSLYHDGARLTKLTYEGYLD